MQCTSTHYTSLELQKILAQPCFGENNIICLIKQFYEFFLFFYWWQMLFRMLYCTVPVYVYVLYCMYTAESISGVCNTPRRQSPTTETTFWSIWSQELQISKKSPRCDEHHGDDCDVQQTAETFFAVCNIMWRQTAHRTDKIEIFTCL